MVGWANLLPSGEPLESPAQGSCEGRWQLRRMLPSRGLSLPFSPALLFKDHSAYPDFFLFLGTRRSIFSHPPAPPSQCLSPCDAPLSPLFIGIHR